MDTSQCKILTLANPPFFEVASTEAFRRRLLVVEMPCRFTSNAAEVDHVSVHPAVDPSALDAAMDAHLGEFFFCASKVRPGTTPKESTTSPLPS